MHELTRTSIEIVEKVVDRKNCKSCDKKFTKTFLTKLKWFHLPIFIYLAMPFYRLSGISFKGRFDHISISFHLCIYLFTVNDILKSRMNELNEWISNYKAFYSVSRKRSTKYVESFKQ